MEVEGEKQKERKFEREIMLKQKWREKSKKKGEE